MDGLQAFFRAGGLEQTGTDACTRNVIQGNTGIGQAGKGAIASGDAIVAHLKQRKIVNFAVQREPGAAYADPGPTDVETILTVQVRAKQFGRNKSTYGIRVAVVFLVLGLDKPPHFSA